MDDHKGSDTVPDSGLASSFQFLAYKVDRLNLRMRENINLLRMSGVIDEEAWDFQVSPRTPYFFTKDKLYLGGLDIRLLLYEKKDLSDADKKPEKALVSVELGISGLFQVVDKNTQRFDKAMEEALVKYQIPTILFPYARSVITTLMSSSGYGAVIFPLVNVNELAKKTLDKVDIKVVD